MSNNTNSAGFGQFVPGFEFLQNLVNPGPAASQGMGAMPNLGGWVAPTFNVEDLEKRIDELKAVHFWLDQNSKALSATIQAMEVQKMTLATLRELNVNFGDLTRAGEAAAEKVSNGFAGFGIPSVAEPAPPAESAPAAPESPGETRAQAPAEKIDPVQWWGALQNQFQSIAANAMQDLAKHDLGASAKKKTGPQVGAKTAAGPKKAAPKKAAPRKKAPVARSRAA
jgi:hypothetical protein